MHKYNFCTTHGEPVDVSLIPKEAKKIKFQKKRKKYICYSWYIPDEKLTSGLLCILVTDTKNIVDHWICPPGGSCTGAPLLN